MSSSAWACSAGASTGAELKLLTSLLCSALTCPTVLEPPRQPLKEGDIKSPRGLANCFDEPSNSAGSPLTLCRGRREHDQSLTHRCQSEAVPVMYVKLSFRVGLSSYLGYACNSSATINERFEAVPACLSPGTNKSKSHAGFPRPIFSENRGATGGTRINSSDKVAANKAYSPRFLRSMTPTVIQAIGGYRP